MRKAIAALMILIALLVLHYYGFVRPVILYAIPTFIEELNHFGSPESSLPYFFFSLSDALFSIAMIFLTFSFFWIGLNLALSKKREFEIEISKSPLVFLSVGSGLLFGAEFIQAFSYLLRISFFETIYYVLLSLIALEITLTLIRNLATNASEFIFAIKFEAK
jgi:type II secretory pathway component PulF